MLFSVSASSIARPGDLPHARPSNASYVHCPRSLLSMNVKDADVAGVPVSINPMMNAELRAQGTLNMPSSSLLQEAAQHELAALSQVP